MHMSCGSRPTIDSKTQGCVQKHPTTLGCHSIFVYVQWTIKIEWHPSVVMFLNAAQHWRKLSLIGYERHVLWAAETEWVTAERYQQQLINLNRALNQKRPIIAQRKCKVISLYNIFKNEHFFFFAEFNYCQKNGKKL